MLIRNGWVFLDGEFAKADVRLNDSLISEVGTLLPSPGEDVRDCAGEKDIERQHIRGRPDIGTKGKRNEGRRETQDAVEPVFAGFTFSLFATCIGILLIFGVLLYYML